MITIGNIPLHGHIITLKYAHAITESVYERKAFHDNIPQITLLITNLQLCRKISQFYHNDEHVGAKGSRDYNIPKHSLK